MASISESLRAEYESRYHALVPRPERTADLDAILRRIVQGRDRYEAVERRTGVPWYVVGVIHSLEASNRFNAHLHNGDPLTARTVHVPQGRPASGEPPFTWEESAADALKKFNGWSDWSVGGTLYQVERYNGWGYQNRRVPSPYLYSFSNQYERGKFASDGHYDPNLVSRQAGAATLLKRMEEQGLITFPPRDVS